MKKIAIIGAMAEEVAILKSALENRKEEKIAEVLFYTGTLNEKEVIILQSGIGKVNASIATTLVCDKYKPELIINTGSAGGVSRDLHISDVVISDKIVHGDVDVTAFKYSFGQVPKMPRFYQGDRKVIKKAEEIYKAYLEKTRNKVVTGLIVTTDSFLSSKEKLTGLTTHFKEVKAVEMEAAAIAQTAYRFGIPFIVIRAISDGADGEAAKSFATFLEKAVQMSSDCVEMLVEKL